MSFDKNKEYLVSFILKDIGRDIQTKASKTYKIGDRVTAEELNKFAQDNEMIFELVDAPIVFTTIKKISIKDYKERPHITALEYIREMQNAEG